MGKTHVRPARDLRNNYAELARIVKEQDHIIITNHGKGESVLISIEEYAEYEKFQHHRYVVEELRKAKEQAENPETVWTDHENLWETIRSSYDL